MNISLHGACFVGELLPSDLEQVNALLSDNPALVSSKDHNGQTPLHLAAVRANKAMVKLLLANAANVNARGIDGLTPLHGVAGLQGAQFILLAWIDYKEVVELLLANGANVNAKDNYSRTPLHHAAINSPFIAELLLANGANVSAREDIEGLTPLLASAAAGTTGVAKLLLAKGADVNARDKEGWTPLRWAVNKNHTDMAELLSQHGGS